MIYNSYRKIQDLFIILCNMKNIWRIRNITYTYRYADVRERTCTVKIHMWKIWNYKWNWNRDVNYRLSKVSFKQIALLQNWSNKIFATNEFFPMRRVEKFLRWELHKTVTVHSRQIKGDKAGVRIEERRTGLVPRDEFEIHSRLVRTKYSGCCRFPLGLLLFAPRPSESKCRVHPY